MKRRITLSQVFELRAFKILLCAKWFDTCIRRASVWAVVAELAFHAPLEFGQGDSYKTRDASRASRAALHPHLEAIER
ncbi:hypothetical protein ACH79_38955 [Bradyrhizobium sp. CCBAU 051011]|nr:hypothetical protein ACH79_38955 [Bradyrhizobium sp. CCBAU 051011]